MEWILILIKNLDRIYRINRISFCPFSGHRPGGLRPGGMRMDKPLSPPARV